MTSILELPSGAVVTVIPPIPPALETAPPTTPPVVLLPSPGPRGSVGPAGDGAPVFGESLAGTQNGINTVFTTAFQYRTGTTAVYINGLRETHYIESDTDEITFEDAPLSGDALRIDYLIA